MRCKQLHKRTADPAARTGDQNRFSRKFARMRHAIPRRDDGF
jgi:hypothetical protein